MKWPAQDLCSFGETSEEPSWKFKSLVICKTIGNINIVSVIAC